MTDDLRQRYRMAISDPGSITARQPGETVPNWASRAVLAVRDEEMADLRAEYAKTCANFEDYAEDTAEEKTLLRAQVADLRQALREAAEWSALDGEEATDG